MADGDSNPLLKTHKIGLCAQTAPSVKGFTLKSDSSAQGSYPYSSKGFVNRPLTSYDMSTSRYVC